jgi:beta-lactamase class A
MSDLTPVSDVIARAERHGAVGVAVLGPGGERFEHNAHRQFRAASVVKVPLMVEVFRLIDRGRCDPSDEFRVGPHEKAPGSGVLLHLHDGITVTLEDLLYVMVAISDNSATNMLIDLAGMDAVNATMRDLGMQRSNLGRPMRGRPAIEGEVENLATPADYLLALEAVCSGTAASPDSCSAMRALLERQQNARRIARFLPEDERIRWGSKTGSIAGVTNDIGFIETPAGRLLLAVFCEGFPDQHDAEQVIGEVARAAWEATALLDFDRPTR